MAEKKWYFQLWALVVAILICGPFALPLAWLNPALSKRMKIFISAIVIILTICFLYASAEIVKEILKEVKELERVMR